MQASQPRSRYPLLEESSVLFTIMAVRLRFIGMDYKSTDVAGVPFLCGPLQRYRLTYPNWVQVRRATRALFPICFRSLLPAHTHHIMGQPIPDPGQSQIPPSQKRLSRYGRIRILALRDVGGKVKGIAAQYNVTRRAIQYTCQQHRSTHQHRKTGRPPKLSRDEVDRLEEFVLRSKEMRRMIYQQGWIFRGSFMPRSLGRRTGAVSIRHTLYLSFMGGCGYIQTSSLCKTMYQVIPHGQRFRTFRRRGLRWLSGQRTRQIWVQKQRISGTLWVCSSPIRARDSRILECPYAAALTPVSHFVVSCHSKAWRVCWRSLAVNCGSIYHTETSWKYSGAW